jgi:hypothetical protein
MSNKDFLFDIILKYLKIKFGIKKIDINDNNDKNAKKIPNVFLRFGLILFLRIYFNFFILFLFDLI